MEEARGPGADIALHLHPSRPGRAGHAVWLPGICIRGVEDFDLAYKAALLLCLVAFFESCALKTLPVSDPDSAALGAGVLKLVDRALRPKAEPLEFAGLHGRRKRQGARHFPVDT